MKKEDISRIIELRASGLSLESLAYKFGVNPATIIRILCDSGHPPTDKAVLISELLAAGTPLDEIALAAETSVETIKKKYVKYAQGSYVFDEKTDNAKRIAKYREHHRNNTSYVEDRQPIDAQKLDPKRQYQVHCYIAPETAYEFECALYKNQVNAGEVLRRYIYNALGKDQNFRLHRSSPKKPVLHDKKLIITCNLRAADYAEFYNYCLDNKTTITQTLKSYILHYIQTNEGGKEHPNV